jgi:hypothetical protein
MLTCVKSLLCGKKWVNMHHAPYIVYTIYYTSYILYITKNTNSYIWFGWDWTQYFRETSQCLCQKSPLGLECKNEKHGQGPGVAKPRKRKSQ